jgi:hypothetical protein
VLCVVAFFTLSYGIQLHRMVTKGEEHAPDASLGLAHSIVLMLFVVGVYFLYWLSRHLGEVCDWSSGRLSLTLWPIFQSPREFAPAFMLAGIAPCLIAMCKFSFAIPMLRSRQSEPLAASRTTGASVGALLSFINLAANIIALRDFFLKGP